MGNIYTGSIQVISFLREHLNLQVLMGEEGGRNRKLHLLLLLPKHKNINILGRFLML